jgi:hypothetical protein
MIESGKCVGGLNLNNFHEFCRHHPALMYPAFELQQALQQNILGQQFWEICSKNRRAEKAKKLKINEYNRKYKQRIFHNNNGNKSNNDNIMCYKEEIATDDMSYKELIRYLEAHGKNKLHCNDDNDTDKEWWEKNDEDQQTVSVTLRKNVVPTLETKQEEEHSHRLERNLNRSAIVTTNSTYQVKMPSLPSSPSTIINNLRGNRMSRSSKYGKTRFSIGQVAVSKRLAHKLSKKSKIRHDRIIGKISPTELSSSNIHDVAVDDKTGNTNTDDSTNKPWTCRHCQRMNLTTQVCKTCHSACCG